MNVDIILIGHRAGSGKDTLANEIIEKRKKDPSDFENEHFPVIQRGAFADFPRKIIAETFNMTNEQLVGNLKETPDKRYLNVVDSEYEYFTPRRLQQLICEQFRELHPPILADHVYRQYFREIESNQKERQVLLISDFRDPIEYEQAFKWATWSPYLDVNVVTVKVDRKRLPDISNHITEEKLNGFERWDIQIDNNGSIEEMYGMFKEKYSILKDPV